jgi:hypothetical protein
MHQLTHFWRIGYDDGSLNNLETYGACPLEVEKPVPLSISWPAINQLLAKNDYMSPKGPRLRGANLRYVSRIKHNLANCDRSK